MLTTSLYRWINRLFPQPCGVCRHRLSLRELPLCADCLVNLPRTDFHLQSQNNTMLQMVMGEVPIERAAAWTFFMPRSDFSQLIYHLKYHHHADYGIALGRLMAEELQASGFFEGVTLIVPVPVSAGRRRLRGYNQSEMLARGIAQVTGLPIDVAALVRHHFTVSQTQLTHQERRQNVADAFSLCGGERLAGHHVLLVDDVCTTGATLKACLSVMKSVADVRFTLLTFGLSRA